MSLTPLDKAFIAADKRPEERMAFYTLFCSRCCLYRNAWSRRR